jgi:hypothetical protein
MNFRQIALDPDDTKFNADWLAALLATFSQLWERHTLRQEFLGSPHWQTQCIYVRGPKDFTFEDYFGSTYAEDYDVPKLVFDAVAELVTPVYRATRATALGRVLVVKMPPGGQLIDHVDEGLYAQTYERVHVALTTNDECALVCNGERLHLPVGEAWWFDHRAPHTADNHGETERIHLIVDLIAPELRNHDGIRNAAA